MSPVQTIEPGDQISPIEKRVTQKMIDTWADVSGDSNPLHVDPEYAKTTHFGGTIAHGHIALGWLSEMMVRWRGIGWLEGGELRGVKFVAPVRPGHTLRVSGSAEKVIEEDGVAKMLCAVIIVDLADERPCVVGSALVPLQERES